MYGQLEVSRRLLLPLLPGGDSTNRIGKSASLVRYPVLEAEGFESAVVYVPRVIAMAVPACGGNGPVVAPLDRQVADDEQGHVCHLPGVVHLIGSEDHLGPVCRGALDFD